VSVGNESGSYRQSGDKALQPPLQKRRQWHFLQEVFCAARFKIKSVCHDVAAPASPLEVACRMILCEGTAIADDAV
jgi:hypothetical protein